MRLSTESIQRRLRSGASEREPFTHRAGLLAISEYAHAQRFVASLETARENDRRRIAERIAEPTIRAC